MNYLITTDELSTFKLLTQEELYKKFESLYSNGVTDLKISHNNEIVIDLQVSCDEMLFWNSRTKKLIIIVRPFKHPLDVAKFITVITSWAEKISDGMILCDKCASWVSAFKTVGDNKLCLNCAGIS